MAKPLMCDSATLKKNLEGKTYVVTGANSGIGLVCAEQLAKQGARVVLACRRVKEAEACCDDIRGKVDGARVEARVLDLGDLSSVRSFAEGMCADFKSIHGLLNNAGVMNTPKGRTKDGFETQLGVNHLGHFLLTELLLPPLMNADAARIVCVSSCYHDQAMGRDGDIHFDDLFFENESYDGWKAYAQSKLANLLHAKGLAKRLEGTGVVAVSVHPGWVRTNLARNTMPVWLQNTLMRPFFSMMGMIGPWEGSQTSLHALLGDDIVPGAFYSQTGIYRQKSAQKGGWPLESPNPVLKTKPELADRLWERSAELVGLSPA